MQRLYESHRDVENLSKIWFLGCDRTVVQIGGVAMATFK